VIKIFVFFLILFSLSATPTQAFNLIDFLFPPVQMEESTRSPPGPALAPEVPSNNTYSNTLKDNPIDCQGTTTISKTWEPVQKDTGTTDANGNPIKEYVDYDAIGPIEDQMDVKNLSNDFYRNFQLFFARGGIKCTKELARADFTNLEADGTSASLRSTPTQQILYYRSLFLLETANSLDQKNPVDTVAQDYQIAWSCSGLCQEFTKQAPSSSCRPVYVSEIIFGLKDEKIYYTTPQSEPTTFPGNIIANIQNYYSNSYSSRSQGKSFSPLSKDIYLLMYQQLNFVPKGNANNKITVVNYNDYNQQTSQPINPVPSTFNRTLPNAAAATSKEAQALSFVNPTNQDNLDNSSLCDNVQSNSNSAIDQPPPLNILLFIKGIFQHVPAGESYTHSESIGITSTYDIQVVSNTQTAEKAYSNMIPSSKNTNLNQSFSSTTVINQNNPIPDPGYRADLLYRQMRSLLRPSSWF
jgi:hypothetical protein